MKPEYTKKEQQAIDGVIVALDSLPGYKKETIYFNGHYVGYKYEPIEQTDKKSIFQTWKHHSFKRILKWNW